MIDRPAAPAPPANLPPSPGAQADAARVEESDRPVLGADSSDSADASVTRDHRRAGSVAVGQHDAPPPDVRSRTASEEDDGSTPGAGSRDGADGDVEVECPGCGLLLVGDSSPRPTAAWFCPRCDYPVFWASAPSEPPSSRDRRARRRLPGTGGRQSLGSSPCWHCGELNAPEIAACLRCAATLPKPIPPTPEQVRIDVEVPLPVPQLVPSATWPFVVATLWVLHVAAGG